MEKWELREEPCRFDALGRIAYAIFTEDEVRIARLETDTRSRERGLLMVLAPQMLQALEIAADALEHYGWVEGGLTGLQDIIFRAKGSTSEEGLTEREK